MKPATKINKRTTVQPDEPQDIFTIISRILLWLFALVILFLVVTTTLTPV